MQITLNEQQIDTLLLILEGERIAEDTSKSYNAIVNQIIDKLTDTIEVK
jgi:hypothetical protein